MRFPPNLVEVASTLVQTYQAITTSLALGGDSCQTFGLSTTATAPGHPVTRLALFYFGRRRDLRNSIVHPIARPLGLE
jgi:hypothetical protein